MKKKKNELTWTFALSVDTQHETLQRHEAPCLCVFFAITLWGLDYSIGAKKTTIATFSSVCE